jgi:hypothetical protein
VKFVFVTLIAALLLSANIAHAKPKAKGAFGCTLTELQLVEAPDLDEIEIIIAVRLTCSNKTAKSKRIKRSDITLVTSEGYQYVPDRSSDNFDVIYEDLDPSPEFIEKFVDIEPGETTEIGFTFTGGSRLTDPELTLDVDGTSYEYHRAPIKPKSAQELKAEQDERAKHSRIWDYK